MPNGSRSAALFLGLLAPIGLAAAPAILGEANPSARLRAMPIELRRTLALNLDRFDRLAPDQRTALLRLDAQLAALGPDERAHDLDLLRRYHLWLQTLTEARRKSLAEAPTQQVKIDLIHKYRADESVSPEAARPDPPIWTMAAVFNPLTLEGEAHEVRCWQVLTPSQRDEVAAKPFEQGRFQRLEELAREKVGPSRHQEILRELNEFRKKYNADVERFNLESKSRNREPRKKFADLDTQARLRLIRPLEDRHFHERTPAPIEAPELIRFESELPPWIRERIASFPPEAARWRLRILYELLHRRPTAEVLHGPMSAQEKPRHPALAAPSTHKPEKTPASPSPAR